MKVAILHDRVPEQGASPDQIDCLVQVAAVCKALLELGHDPFPLAATLDLGLLRERLGEINPHLVFNLVESLEGHGRLIHLAPSLMDSLGILYTGASTEAIFLTTGKLLTKRLLRDAGIPTPSSYSPAELPLAGGWEPGSYIIKSVWEHASAGLDENSVVRVSRPEELLKEMLRREADLGGECFAEAYIEGREFNLSVLAGEAGTQVLPAAEIRFVDFPEGKHRIVGYRAKWHETSFEYLHTVRSFEFSPEDGLLLSRLADTAMECWNLFRLQGYARVDFRVDRDLRPWVLEINVNPCLAPDAGFAAAAARAGLTFSQVVERILGDCRIPTKKSFQQT